MIDEDELYGLHCDIGRLEVENAKLRERNARLQERCKKMYEQIKYNCDVCDECYCSSWDEDNECCVYDTYMHELGIEVE